MTENANILTTPSVTPSRHQVVALAYDGLCTFEFGVAVEIFGLPRPEMGDNWYQFAVAAVDEGPLCATGGIRLMTDGGPELLAQADTIVVPGWRGVDALVPEALCAALASAHARGCRIISICSGVFRSRRRRAAQWPPGDNPLALHRGAAVPFSADPGGGGRPLRGAMLC
ncbi:AraC family transcriptional regulator [Klebsiella pneumoniae subsp. ozaenae]|uniref:AraC family transcriptional regulator n=1 Tax=Klebsiella pneumoniae subsp. ozaenae TaxID=574 RepID=A0A378B1E9_KLEPO|nr:AraC family transcriptional regulator [Klebsiella pneumoniae subsp. ozaenae]